MNEKEKIQLIKTFASYAWNMRPEKTEEDVYKLIWQYTQWVICDGCCPCEDMDVDEKFSVAEFNWRHDCNIKKWSSFGW